MNFGVYGWHRAGIVTLPESIMGVIMTAAAAALIVMVTSAVAYTGAAHALSLSDATGLVNRIEIPSGAQVYEVVVTSSFDIVDYSFDVSDVILTLQTGPVLSENLAEIVVPHALLSGDIGVRVDGMQHDTIIRTADAVSLLVLRFAGSDDGATDDDDNGNTGDDGSGPVGRTIEITGTETMATASYALRYDPGAVRALQDAPADDDNAGSSTNAGNGGGCLVATAAFGSEMNMHVQNLREVRDTKVATTESGRAFLAAFNSVYYAFSPHVADLERENPVFRDLTRAYLYPMLLSLGIMENVQEGSETDVLGYGMLVIALNLGMYAAPPAAVVAVALVRVAHLIRH